MIKFSIFSVLKFGCKYESFVLYKEDTAIFKEVSPTFANIPPLNFTYFDVKSSKTVFLMLHRYEMKYYSSAVEFVPRPGGPNENIIIKTNRKRKCHKIIILTWLVTNSFAL